jgi:acyl carrier protein
VPADGEKPKMNSRIRRVFREVFNDGQMEIWDSMSARDIAGWDSLAQVKLLIGLEEEFGVKFSTREVTQLDSVAKIKEALSQKVVHQ